MSEEREHLLGPTKTTPQRTLSIAHLARALAALRASKLPSSSQLAALLRAFLRSPILEIEGNIFSTRYGSGRVGTGALTKEGELVRQGLRSVVQASLKLVEQKDPDDRMQELVYACRNAQLCLSRSSVLSSEAALTR